MQLENRILKNEERVALMLRDLYRRHGYSCYKMSKFEEYDLYSQHKDFLVSDSVITFNDTNGRLMALKPDVTLSIVKHFKENVGGVQRVYYNENVYRVSDKTHEFKEILQIGLECMGQIDRYNLMEVVGLAAESLRSISERFVLNISHLGILSALLEGAPSQEARSALIRCVGEKNVHELTALCGQYQIPAADAKLLAFLAAAYGDPAEVLAALRARTKAAPILQAAEQLEAVVQQVRSRFGDLIRLDLSLTSDMNYYNGIVFQGFLEGIPSGVLSGGQYDRLMARMGKRSDAIGFAVYLDLLERMQEATPYTVDILLLYSPQDDPAQVLARAAALIAEGQIVSAQTTIPAGLNYREIEYFGGQSRE